MKIVLIGIVSVGCSLLDTGAVRAQSANDGSGVGQPSDNEIKAFCQRYTGMSVSEQRQYRAQYEQYCKQPEIEPETTIIAPVEPDEPNLPREPKEPERAEADEEERDGKEMEPDRELETKPTMPEPVIPEPEPVRVDLTGRLALMGPVARKPGERQRFRITVTNRGPDAPPGNRLWTRVFLSKRDVSRRQASGGAFSLPRLRQGQRVVLPDVPGPGQSRETTAAVTLPPALDEGEYWWCVQVDSRRKVAETDEANNIACARKVVALAGRRQGDSELSALFGSKVDQLKAPRQTDTPGPVSVAESIASLPENIQPAIEQMNTLFLNGSLDPVVIPADGAAQVDWSRTLDGVADKDQPNGLWLLVSGRSLTPMDCLGGLETRFGDRADARLRRLDEGPVSLSLGSDYYEAGSPYHLMGCYWKDGVFSGEWTNEVSFYYGDRPWLADAAETAEIQPLSHTPPDLVITDAFLVRGGEDKGSLVIPFRNRNAGETTETPAGVVPYYVYVLPANAAAEVSEFGDVTGNPAELVGKDNGIVRIREGTPGGIILTEPVIPSGPAAVEEVRHHDRVSTRKYSYTVFLAINRSPFSPYFERDDEYMEGDYQNNHFVKEFFRRGLVTVDSILDIRVEEFHGTWARVRIRYNLVSQPNSRLTLAIQGAADTPDTVSWQCATGPDGALIRGGVNKEVEYVCVLEGAAADPVESELVSATMYLDPDSSLPERTLPDRRITRELAYSRRWRTDGEIPDEALRPDLLAAIPTTGHEYRESGGRVRVAFSNAGYDNGDFPFRVVKTTRWLSGPDCTWQEESLAVPLGRRLDLTVPLGRPDDTTLEREFALGPAGPALCNDFLESFSPSAKRAEVRIKVIADPDNTVDERTRHNNTVEQVVRDCVEDDTPGLTGSGLNPRNVARVVIYPFIPNEPLDRGGLVPSCE